MLRQLMICAAALASPAAAMQQGGDQPLSVNAVRFYSAGSGSTTIEALAEVRPALLNPGTGSTRYRVEVAVQDSAGLELQRSDWSREVPAAAAGDTRTKVVESFSFAAAPGLYRVHVRVVPQQGTAAERRVDVRSFIRPPATSDLVLATEVRSDTAAAGPGEIRRGGYVMRTAPLPKLTPAEATLNWYVELYPRASAASGELAAEVVAADGRVIVRTAPRVISIGAAGAATPGSLDLAGLPEGAYRIRLQLRLPDTTLAVEAPFEMASVTALAAVPAEAGSAAVEDMFEGASEARLDSLFAPLVFLADELRQSRTYNRLAVEGKRRWLREFWQERDPTQGTAANERRDAFYRAVQYANERYGEPGRGEVPGWNTDRGRIYLKYSAPDEILPRPSAERPYEVWKYTRGQQRYYLFIDQSGLGHYSLIGTNDQRERGRPNWEGLVGREITQDVYRFLGRNYDPFASDNNPN